MDNETRQAIVEGVKRVRAQRHSIRRKLDDIGIKALCEMINKSSVEQVANELAMPKNTLYKYLELNGARRVIRYVVVKKKGA